jgi:hypothetical protein
MSWERRKRGGWYYTRSRHVAGRVIRQYFGRGAAAEEASREDLARRKAREKQRLAWQQEEGISTALEARLATFDRAAESFLRAALYAAGYYLHKRGEWRRHRG